MNSNIIKSLDITNSSIIDNYSGTGRKVLELSISEEDIYPDGGKCQYLYKEDVWALVNELARIADTLSSKGANNYVNKDKEIG